MKKRERKKTQITLNMNFFYKNEEGKKIDLKSFEDSECLFHAIYINDTELIKSVFKESKEFLYRLHDTSSRMYILECYDSIISGELEDTSIRCLFIQMFTSFAEFRDSIRENCDEVRWFLALPFFLNCKNIFNSGGDIKFKNLPEFAEFCMGSLIRREYNKILCFINDSYEEYISNWCIYNIGQYEDMRCHPELSELESFGCQLYSFKSIADKKKQIFDGYKKKFDSFKDDNLIELYKSLKSIGNINQNLNWIEISCKLQFVFENSYVSNKKRKS